jgi:hypothetical protein
VPARTHVYPAAVGMDVGTDAANVLPAETYASAARGLETAAFECVSTYRIGSVSWPVRLVGWPVDPEATGAVGVSPPTPVAVPLRRERLVLGLVRPPTDVRDVDLPMYGTMASKSGRWLYPTEPPLPTVDIGDVLSARKLYPSLPRYPTQGPVTVSREPPHHAAPHHRTAGAALACALGPVIAYVHPDRLARATGRSTGFKAASCGQQPSAPPGGGQSAATAS